MFAVPDHANNNHIFKHRLRRAGLAFMRKKIIANLNENNNNNTINNNHNPNNTINSNDQNNYSNTNHNTKYIVGTINDNEFYNVIGTVMDYINSSEHKKMFETSVLSIWNASDRVSPKIQEFMNEYETKYKSMPDEDLFEWKKTQMEKEKILQAKGETYDKRLLKYKNHTKAYACDLCPFTCCSKYNDNAFFHYANCPRQRNYPCVPMLQRNDLLDDLLQSDADSELVRDDSNFSKVELRHRLIAWSEEQQDDAGSVVEWQAAGIIVTDLGKGIVLTLCHKWGEKGAFYFEALDLQRLFLNGTSRIWRTHEEHPKASNLLVKKLNRIGFESVKMLNKDNDWLLEIETRRVEYELQTFNDGKYKYHAKEKMQKLQVLEQEKNERLHKRQERRTKKNSDGKDEKQNENTNSSKSVNKSSRMVKIFSLKYPQIKQVLNTIVDESDETVIDIIQTGIEYIDYSEISDINYMRKEDVVDLVKYLLQQDNKTINSIVDKQIVKL